MLIPGRKDTWRTKRLARQLTKGDRVFFWESGGKLRLIAFGEIVDPNRGKNSEGCSLYGLRYLTRRFAVMPTLEELRQLPDVRDASFLKAGPATSIFPLTQDQAHRLFAYVVAQNSDLQSIWPELAGENHLLISDSFALPDYEALEGKPRLVQHLRRERDRSLVKRKKVEVLRQSGRLLCEVCSFDFKAFYGSIGEGFCEAHHNKPLSSENGERKTSLSDLAILCSNCHRVIHLTDPMMNVKELNNLVSCQRKMISKG